LCAKKAQVPVGDDNTHSPFVVPNKQKECNHQCLLFCCIKISPSFYSEMVPNS